MKAAAIVFAITTGSVAFLAAGCGGGGTPASDPPAALLGADAAAAAAAVPGPKHPAPYTADQLRAATKPGRTYRYRVEAKGEPPSERTMTFASVDAGGADVAVTGEPKRRVTWEELRQHAEFPAALVRTREETLTVPAGTFDCIVYVVLGDHGEASTFFFAKDLPGAPVQFFTNKEGRRTTTSTLVEYRPGT